MWAKGHSARPQRPVIGNPTLVNKTLDDSVYESLSPIASPTADGGSRDLPLAAKPPHSDNRVASSIYSRDGVEQLGESSTSWRQFSSEPDYKPNSSVWHETTEVSPLDSPVSASGANDSHRSVSPIEDEPGPASGSAQMDKSKHGSHLPVLHRFPRKESLTQLGGSKSGQGSRVTRWDDFSGEPTTGGAGKAGQVAPGRVPFQSHASPKQPASQPSGIFSWSREQLQPIKKFAAARSRLSKTTDNALPQMKEPWKGASGRMPMMNPLQEKQRGRAPSRADPEKENLAPPVPAAGFRPTVVTTITAGESVTPTQEKRSASKNKIESRPSPPPSQDNNRTTPPRVDLPESTMHSALADLHLEEQPPSRFSSTTYETTEPGSATDSPRDSVVIENQSTENLNSIMSRKRPVIPSGMIAGKKPTRKPTPSQASEELTSKPLPDCPPEKQAESRIEALEARREALARRMGNIDTIIHELTQVIQPSSIAYDIAVRDEVKRTVSSLNNELADIKREDHEIGLTLFRAYKKRDDNGAYGSSTSFWVKRVTS